LAVQSALKCFMELPISSSTYRERSRLSSVWNLEQHRRKAAQRSLETVDAVVACTAKPVGLRFPPRGACCACGFWRRSSAYLSIGPQLSLVGEWTKLVCALKASGSRIDRLLTNIMRQDDCAGRSTALRGLENQEPTPRLWVFCIQNIAFHSPANVVSTAVITTNVMPITTAHPPRPSKVEKIIIPKPTAKRRRSVD